MKIMVYVCYVIRRTDILLNLDTLVIKIQECIDTTSAFMPLQVEFWNGFL